MTIQLCPECNHGIISGTATVCENCLYGLRVVKIQIIRYPICNRTKGEINHI